MFDIGFWELVVISVVALLVIGPERLPAFAQDAGKWIRKIRYIISATRTELERELKLDEVKDLKGSINEIDRLMENAPDRLHEMTRLNTKSSQADSNNKHNKND